MRIVKPTPISKMILCVFLHLAVCHFLSGCSGPVIAEIAEGVTEGIIDQIEEYVQEKDHKK